MKHILNFVIVYFVFVLPVIGQYKNRDLFAKEVTLEYLSEIAGHLPDWRLSVKNNILKELRSLPEEQRKALIRTGERRLGFEWPALPAWNYLDFVRNGNRSVFQSKWSERRRFLYNLVAAELAENEGRFLPQIINGVWAICEESSWCYPAHIGVQGVSGLPDPAQDIIDLGAGETSLNLSWVYMMLRESLEKVSPMITKRIRFELDKRIIQPYLNTDFWWMGFPNRKVNNWNIWINRNMLYTIALTGENDSVTIAFIDRVLHSSDNFINGYGDDGGCEEGTHYWEAAPGYMIRLIGLVKDISKGQVDISQNPLVKRMGQYIYKMHIDGRYFVDYGDASPTPGLPSLVIFDYGKIIGDTTMMQFASYLAANGNYASSSAECNHLLNYFENLTLRDEILNMPAQAPYVQCSWYPDIEVMVERDNPSGKGLFLSAVGGNNGVSHSHNDVGNFIVYVDGKPAIIDAGVGTYTAQTFSSRRYEIWTMQSSWHNLPAINGVQQKDGSEYKTRDVQYSARGNRATLEMDIAEAYPAEAKVKSWNRSLTFNRNKNIILKEAYELFEYIEPGQLHLMTPLEVSVEKGKIVLKNIENGEDAYGLELRYDSKLFDVRVEEKEMDDTTLKRLWAGGLKRIVLTSKSRSLKSGYTISMSQL